MGEDSQQQIHRSDPVNSNGEAWLEHRLVIKASICDPTWDAERHKQSLVLRRYCSGA